MLKINGSITNFKAVEIGHSITPTDPPPIVRTGDKGDTCSET